MPDYIIRGDSTYFVVTDHLGSVRLVMNKATGVVVHEMNYDEFGNQLITSNSKLITWMPFGYASGIYDNDTKLIQFGKRDYDTNIGRWTRKDPIKFWGGGLNHYCYVSSDPINWIDPVGLSELIYDRSNGELQVWPDDGVGPPQVFPAGNVTVNPTGDPLVPESLGPAPNGTFPMGELIETGQDPCSSFGSAFIPIILPVNESGQQRTGVGLHAGKNCKKGVDHPTNGCIRSTEEGLDALRNDPPTQITIGD